MTELHESRREWEKRLLNEAQRIPTILVNILYLLLLSRKSAQEVPCGNRKKTRKKKRIGFVKVERHSLNQTINKLGSEVLPCFRFSSTYCGAHCHRHRSHFSNVIYTQMLVQSILFSTRFSLTLEGKLRKSEAEPR